MRITVIALGSRGDVQPFFTLAYGLAQAGHDVILVANAIYASLAEAYQLNLRPISWDPLESMQLQSMIIEGNWNTKIAKAREFQKLLQRIYHQVQSEVWERCRDAEHLVYSHLPWGYSIAEKLAIPALPVTLYPISPTRYFPTQLVTTNLGAGLNLLSHYLAEQILERIVLKFINQFRIHSLQLAPIQFPDTITARLRKSQTPLLCHLSPSVIPRPPDWPETIQMHGFWFLPEPSNWNPSPDLEDFIQQEPKPVYIGFGSMVYKHKQKLEDSILQALKRSGQRAVISKGWGDFRFGNSLPKEIFLVDDIPFYWLFPQMKAIIHHGGAGTTAAALRAGVPELVVPYMQEQPFWAKCIYQMGVSPVPIPFSKLTTDRLTQGLVRVTQDQALQQRARKVGEQIRDEQGLERTVEFIEGYFQKQEDAI